MANPTVYGASFERHVAEVLNHVRDQYVEGIEKPFTESLVQIYAAGVADGFQQGLSDSQERVDKRQDVLEILYRILSSENEDYDSKDWKWIADECLNYIRKFI